MVFKVFFYFASDIDGKMKMCFAKCILNEII